MQFVIAFFCLVLHVACASSDFEECQSLPSSKPHGGRALLQVASDAPKRAVRDCNPGDAIKWYINEDTYYLGMVRSLFKNGSVRVDWEADDTGENSTVSLDDIEYECSRNGSISEDSSNNILNNIRTESNASKLTNATSESNVTHSTNGSKAAAASANSTELAEYLLGEAGVSACPGNGSYERVTNVSECERIVKRGYLGNAKIFWVSSGCFEEYNVKPGCFTIGPSVFFQEESCKSGKGDLGAHTSYVCKRKSEQRQNITAVANVSKAELLFDLLDANKDGHISKGELADLGNVG